MIHSFFKNTPANSRNNTYSPYFLHRPPPDSRNTNPKHRRHRLLLLLLARATARTLRDSWQTLLSHQLRGATALLRMAALA